MATPVKVIDHSRGERIKYYEVVNDGTNHHTVFFNSQGEHRLNTDNDGDPESMVIGVSDYSRSGKFHVNLFDNKKEADRLVEGYKIFDENETYGISFPNTESESHKRTIIVGGRKEAR